MAQEVTITSYQPDLVLMHGKEVHLLELTVCGNSEKAMAAVHQRQSTKLEYIHLISDATRAGWRANYTALEIDVLVHQHQLSYQQPIQISIIHTGSKSYSLQPRLQSVACFPSF